MYNIPNRIKQPARCCINCGKGYNLKSALDKHVILCELVTRTNKKKKLVIVEEEEEVIIPNSKQLYHMIIELTAKYDKLSKKMEEVSKYAVKEKKKINILEWLNNNNTSTSLTCSFQEFSANIKLDNTQMNFIFNNTYNDILNEIFNQYIAINNVNNVENIPLAAFIQKSNTLFIFTHMPNNTNNYCWMELPNDLFITFLISIQMKISKLLYEWKQAHKEELESNDKLCELYNKTLVKIMTPEFKQERYYTKAKTLLYNKLKKDIKFLIEYEFEF
jgi:hypothetical protein